MLTNITIDAFQRIAHAALNLEGHSIHLFAGDNEAGKSSLIEAIAFALRGLSPRVRYKQDFEQLVNRGKKNGVVSLKLDGFDISRQIKTGKLSTTAPLDYPELLVDLLLSREKFGRSDDAALRKLMTWLFKVEGDVDFVMTRLKARGIQESMAKRVLSLIPSGGFSAAFDVATNKVAELRGAWQALTQEKYGSVKANDWTPPELSLYQVSDEALIDKERAVLAERKRVADLAQQSLGALRSAVSQASQAQGLESLESLQTAAQSLRDVKEAYLAEQVKLRNDTDRELGILNAEIEKTTAEIQRARMAAATLECPGCMKPLVLHTLEGGKVSLVSAQEPRREGQSLEALMSMLNETKEIKQELADRNRQKSEKLQRQINDCGRELSGIEAKLDLRNKVDKLEQVVTEADIQAAEKAGADASVELEMQRSKVAKLENDNKAHAAAKKKEADAATYAQQIAQWQLVADALSNKPDSIPSELIDRTVGPLNALLLEVNRAWGEPPIVLSAGMQLSRGDGTPYHLLSESARWRVEVAIQLALAAIGPLKLVAIDRFDKLSPSRRGAFIDLLEWYAGQYSDVTVLVCGTLKEKPDLDGAVQAWWVEEGSVS